MTNNVLETFMAHKAEYQEIETGFDKAILIPEGHRLASLEKFRVAPNMISAERKFDDIRGFVDYINDFKGESTVCFAGSEELKCYLDYHKKGSPSWNSHTISYDIKNSNRWKIWERAHNKWMSQRDFAEFLDTGLNEIVDPSQSDILTLVKNFRATVNYDVDYEETSGGTNFKYNKTIKSGTTKKEQIQVPETILINLQPFENLNILNKQISDDELKIPAYQLRAKINWRINVDAEDHRGAEIRPVEFKIQILNFETAVDETLESLRSAISELTQVKTYIG